MAGRPHVGIAKRTCHGWPPDSLRFGMFLAPEAGWRDAALQQVRSKTRRAWIMT